MCFGLSISERDRRRYLRAQRVTVTSEAWNTLDEECSETELMRERHVMAANEELVEVVGCETQFASHLLARDFAALDRTMDETTRSGPHADRA